MDTAPDAPTAPNHHAHHPGFSGVSGFLAGLTMVRGRDEVARVAADLTGLAAGDRLVDIGCGPGVAAREAARRGAQVTGVEPAAPMRTLARLLSTGRRGRVSWIEGVAEHLPVPDASATVVWALSTVHHWPDVERGLAECRRVLRPGGRFLAMERRTRPGATGHASHGWTEAQAATFAAQCRAAGFATADVDTTTLKTRDVLSVLAR